MKLEPGGVQLLELDLRIIPEAQEGIDHAPQPVLLLAPEKPSGVLALLQDAAVAKLTLGQSILRTREGAVSLVPARSPVPDPASSSCSISREGQGVQD